MEEKKVGRDSRQVISPFSEDSLESLGSGGLRAEEMASPKLSAPQQLSLNGAAHIFLPSALRFRLRKPEIFCRGMTRTGACYIKSFVLFRIYRKYKSREGGEFALMMRLILLNFVPSIGTKQSVRFFVTSSWTNSGDPKGSLVVKCVCRYILLCGSL